MQYAVDESIAMADVEAFLDAKKMKPRRREQLKQAIEAVVEAIMLGDVVFDNANGKIIQNLNFPIVEGQNSITFNTRIKAEVLNSRYKKIENTAQSKADAIIECTCGLLPALVNRMEATDKDVSDSIALFFM